jgi:hypothetical protein
VQPTYAHPQVGQQQAYSPPPSYGQPPYQPGPPVKAAPPRKSNVPLVAVIAAVSLLLCGGMAVAGVLAVRNIADRTKQAVDEIPDIPDMPTFDPLPTEAPELPGAPTYGGDDPATPVTVVYEVTGDGKVDITYTAKRGESPQRVKGAKLPWRMEVTMSGASYVSVMAFRTGTTKGSVNCTATVDGEEVAQRSAEGTFAIVTCSKLIY